MAKRGQHTSKKGKSTTGNKGKRAGGKRGAKSKASKKSTSSKKTTHNNRHKKAPSKFNLFMKTSVQK